MVKYLYKVVVLMIVFAASLFFFGSRLQSDIYEEGTEIQVGQENFPYLSVVSQDIEMNRMYGYSGPIDDNIVRESITPLDTSKKIKLKIGGGQVRFVKFAYNIVDKESGEIYDSGAIPSIDEDADEIELEFAYGFQTSTEYILSLTATTDSGRKVHYFTRLKYYEVDSHLADKLNFVKQFHQDTFSKPKAEELQRYLETDPAQVNDTLALVNIKSDSDLVTWGQLSPKKLSEPIPIVKEFNLETACYQFQYFVEGTTSSGTEKYLVNEFYRVRFASGTSYLLNFERTLEAVFDSKMTSVQKNQIKIGITNETNMDIMADQDSENLYFARQGNLYCYDMNKQVNRISKLYSSYSEDASYEYQINAQQQIRLLKVDAEGNLFFAVYGYFPRGQYEGKVAIVLYEYQKHSDSLNELVYLPMDTTYQQLRQDFDDYGYVSERNVYYFTVANVVYSYNMEARRLTRIAENITDQGFQVMSQSDSYVWSDSLDNGYGETLTIFRLDTEEKRVVTAPSADEYIRLLGVINDNVVYGYVRKKDIVATKAGTPLAPCYKIMIADREGNELKSYGGKNRYVTKVKVEGHVMTLSRVKRTGNKKFRNISDDSILNQTETETSAYDLKARVTSGTLTEWYIGFPSKFIIDAVPAYHVPEERIITSGRSVHLDDLKVPKYYVYALGKITGAYEDPAEAIRQADEQMGVVISGSHRVVWERSGSFLMNSIAGIEMYEATSKISNLVACTYMVLKANHFAATPEQLAKKNRSIYQMFGQYMDEPVNLSGITLEQALYFVSSNRYVIGMTGNSTAVVICGYDTKTVTVYNPGSGKREEIPRGQMETIFKEAGNHFVSYIK